MSFHHSFQTTLLVSLLIALGYVWYRVPVPCRTTLEYSIGAFDERFNLSRERFLAKVEAAEKPWERSLGKDLFRYRPEAAFKLNLIYDERQQRTVEQQELEASRQALEEKQESLLTTQAKRLASFNAKKAAYEAGVASFQTDLSEYNRDVASWNERGGAPPDEYEKLQATRKKLERRQKDLESQRAAINKLANEINATSKQSVATVAEYNSQVTEFLERHEGEAEDFEEGIFNGQAIEIYQFEDEAHLRGVLAHELGHWIGIDHVANSRSIMYHLMGGQDLAGLTLTPEDQAALQAVCQRTRLDIFRERLSLALELLQDRFSLLREPS